MRRTDAKRSWNYKGNDRKREMGKGREKEWQRSGVRQTGGSTISDWCVDIAIFVVCVWAACFQTCWPHAHVACLCWYDQSLPKLIRGRRRAALIPPPLHPSHINRRRAKPIPTQHSCWRMRSLKHLKPHSRRSVVSSQLVLCSFTEVVGRDMNPVMLCFFHADFRFAKLL